MGASYRRPMRQEERTGSGEGQPRLIGIQYLRALAAMMVLSFHAVGRQFPALQFLGTGVDLFFVISGFVMVVATGPATTPRSFVLRRLIRIVPLYWFATAAAVIIARFVPPFQYRLDHWNVAASFLFIPSASSWDGMLRPVIGQGWTLNYEMEFYLIFAASLLVPGKWRVGLTCAALMAIVGCGLALAPRSAVLAFWTHPILLEFVVGIGIARLWQRGLPLVWPSLACASLLCAFAWFLPPEAFATTSASANALVRPLLTVFFGPLVCAVLALERRAQGIARWRAALLLGDASYAIYLFQYFVLLFVAGLELRHSIGWPLHAGIVLVGGTALGVAIHLAIERPLLAWLHRRLRGKAAVILPSMPSRTV